jgi:hypothetical protein
MIDITPNRHNTVEFSLKDIVFPAKLFEILSASDFDKCKSNGDARKVITTGNLMLEGRRLSIPDVNLSFDSSMELEGKLLQFGNKFMRFIN